LRIYKSETKLSKAKIITIILIISSENTNIINHFDVLGAILLINNDLF